MPIEVGKPTGSELQFAQNPGAGVAHDDSDGAPEEAVRVCMLQSSSSLTIPVRVCGLPVVAVVDSAAEVTIFQIAFSPNCGKLHLSFVM